MDHLPHDKKILLFDSQCLLCNYFVRMVITHDKKDVFRFLGLQSALGQQLVRSIGIDVLQMDTVILYQQGTYLYKASAVFAIAKELGGRYALLSYFSILPIRFSNAVYDYIARNRYRWCNKKETCTLQTPEIKSKFL